MEGTYSIQCECSNCEQVVTVELPKGERCDGFHDCPNCGCNTATKRKRPLVRDAGDGDPRRWPSSPKKILCGTLLTSGELAQKATFNN